mmetsp:Transcript_8092/g.20978  ORF Transcript_8092/g.20978 Transcript_8092/m.20978 type:complete len:219 (-) Transcript_8092:439-1095(-)
MEHVRWLCDKVAACPAQLPLLREISLRRQTRWHEAEGVRARLQHVGQHETAEEEEVEQDVVEPPLGWRQVVLVEGDVEQHARDKVDVDRPPLGARAGDAQRDRDAQRDGTADGEHAKHAEAHAERDARLRLGAQLDRERRRVQHRDQPDGDGDGDERGGRVGRGEGHPVVEREGAAAAQLAEGLAQQPGLAPARLGRLLLRRLLVLGILGHTRRPLPL